MVQTDATLSVGPIPVDAEGFTFDGDAGQDDESHLGDGVHGFSGGLPVILCRKSFAESVLPVIWVTAVMLDYQNPQAVFLVAVVDGVGEPPHQVTANVPFDDSPTIGRGLNLRNRRVELAQEAFTQTRNALLVEAYRVQEFLFGVGVIDDLHPRTRRAASITCSWERPIAWAEVSSASRRRACWMAS